MLGMQFCSRAKWRGEKRTSRVEEERNGWRTIAGQRAEEEEEEEGDLDRAWGRDSARGYKGEVNGLPGSSFPKHRH